MAKIPEFKYVAGRLLCCCLLVCPGLFAEEPALVPVRVLPRLPQIDGDLSDWGTDFQRTAQQIPTMPSYTKSKAELEDSNGWSPKLLLQVGVHGDSVVFALEWQDERKDGVYRPWQKRGERYLRSNRKDDMAALRFDLEGDFEDCMLAGTEYTVDVWLWMAGRSSITGYADDMTHRFAVDRSAGDHHFKSAAGVPVAIEKIMDEGDDGRGISRPPASGADDILPAVIRKGDGKGSRVDVQAVAQWREGVWRLEVKRSLKVTDAGDVEFRRGGSKLGQIALFDAGYRTRKQVSDILKFDFSKIK